MFNIVRNFICTITEKSSVTFSLGGDNLKPYFDQRYLCPFFK